MWIETQFAWYMLRRPSQLYKDLFTEFYLPHRITQLILSSVTENPAWTYREFCNAFAGSYDDLLQQTLQESDFHDSVRTVPLFVA